LTERIESLPSGVVSADLVWSSEFDVNNKLAAACGWKKRLGWAGAHTWASDQLERVSLGPIAGTSVLYFPLFVK
jgi:hypothetical protein